jgi:hypothetical protein
MLGPRLKLGRDCIATSAASASAAAASATAGIIYTATVDGRPNRPLRPADCWGSTALRSLWLIGCGVLLRPKGLRESFCLSAPDTPALDVVNLRRVHPRAVRTSTDVSVGAAAREAGEGPQRGAGEAPASPAPRIDVAPAPRRSCSREQR